MVDTDDNFFTRNRLMVFYVLSLLVLIFSQVLCVVIGDWLVPSVDQTYYTNDLPSIFSMLLSISVMPLLEEWLFRKKAITFFNRYLPYLASICVSSLLFSFSHLQVYFVPYFVAGLIYSYVYLKTGRLWFSVLLHASYNGVSLGLFLWEVGLF